MTLIAEPEEGYLFDYWVVDGEKVSTEESYKLTLESDIKLTAHFHEDELHNLITKAEAALNKKSWEGAGSYLDEASDLPGAEDKTILKRVDKVQTRSKQYLEKPLVLYFGNKWDTGNVVFCWVTVFSPGPLLHDGLFWGQDIKPIDTWADEEKVFISLELKEAFSFAGYDFEAGEQYQLIYDIFRKDEAHSESVIMQLRT